MKKLLIICIVPILLLACATTADIHENPERYAGKTVVLSGRLTKRLPVPFTELAVFVFEDNYGSALVFSGREHSLEEPVIVKGKVAVFPASGAEKEMNKLVSEVADFLVENGWVERKHARKVSKAASKVFSTVMKGLGKAFIILESKESL